MSFLNGMILAEWVDGSGKNGSLISINTVEIKKWTYIAWQSSDLRNLTRLGVQDIFQQNNISVFADRISPGFANVFLGNNQKG